MAYINSCLGLGLAAEQIAPLLSKMQLAAAPVEDGTAVRVEVPISRSDVLHGGCAFVCGCTSTGVLSSLLLLLLLIRTHVRLPVLPLIQPVAQQPGAAA